MAKNKIPLELLEKRLLLWSELSAEENKKAGYDLISLYPRDIEVASRVVKRFEKLDPLKKWLKKKLKRLNR